MTSNIQDFISLLPERGRLMALDVGSTTIGLALSDASRMIASPLFTIVRKKFKTDMDQLLAFIKEHTVCGLMVGYPINMDGSHGPRTQSTRAFVSELQKRTPLPVLLWDERMTTMAVERVMLDADMSRARRAELVDKLAASYMLQGGLDLMRNLA